MNYAWWALWCIRKHSWWILNVLFLELQICVICQQIHGSCTQCCKCSTYYHAMCASKAGYRMEVICSCSLTVWVGILAVAPVLYTCFTSHAYHFSSGEILSQVEVIDLSIGMYRILSLSFILSLLLNYLPSKLQLHCLEKNGRQTTRMISYCAYHRYRVLIFYD